MKKQKIAVIGYGMWGKNIVRNFYNLNVLDTVCDLDEETRKKIKTLYPSINVIGDMQEVIDNPENYEYPTTRDASGVNPVFVGRIRRNLAFENGISLWCVADNLRIGAALNTVRICKKVIEMGLYGKEQC